MNIESLPGLVLEAERRIREAVRRTYLVHSPAYSAWSGANVYFKCENLQLTGSFKIRGAMNKVLSMSEEQRRCGVVAASTGNHGKAVAFAAGSMGFDATVVVPSNTEPTKLSAVERAGAVIEFAGEDCVEAEAAARRIADEREAVYVSPYNDELVVAGQGVIGVEICEQLAEIDAVFAAVGGGGLISGIAAHVKAVHPRCRVVGSSPACSAAMAGYLASGRLVEPPPCATLSDGTAGGIETGSVTLETCRRLVDEMDTVSEVEIGRELRRFIETESMLIEGAAAVPIASLMKGRPDLRGRNVVVVLCGSNIGARTLAQLADIPVATTGEGSP